MDNFRRTALGGLSQTCAMMGLPLPQIANTTLNEKLSIQANATLGVNETPRAKYMCIGIGGHQSSSSSAHWSLRTQNPGMGEKMSA